METIELGFTCRLSLVILGVIVALSVIASHLSLLRLERDGPETLRRAGIVRIDWWFRCMFGVLLLAFGSHGSGLSVLMRSVFRTYVISVSLFLLGLVSCSLVNA